MKNPVKRLVLIHSLPFIHLLVCLIIATAKIESGWETMLMADFPMSVIVVAIIYNFDHPLLLYGTLGTLWWYLISRTLEMVWLRLFSVKSGSTTV
jgi:hypothetical protein